MRPSDQQPSTATSVQSRLTSETAQSLQLKQTGVGDEYNRVNLA